MTNTTTAKTNTFRTRAAFLVNHLWTWRTFTSTHANSHAAIAGHAKEIGATRYETANADHEFADRANF